LVQQEANTLQLSEISMPGGALVVGFILQLLENLTVVGEQP